MNFGFDLQNHHYSSCVTSRFPLYAFTANAALHVSWMPERAIQDKHDCCRDVTLLRLYRIVDLYTIAKI
ncbi:hypothetical protein Cal6303_3419 [Calothrix sp. PCC 6303]|nr:hypothetical protein Cal6303_3419 [Calothrix sp. PCC 6303]